MHPGHLFADAEEDGTDGVADAAGEQQVEAICTQDIPGLGEEQGDAPAHADVADHGKNLVLLQIDGGEGGSQCSQCPFGCEESPADEGILGSDGGEDDGGIGTGDEAVDTAVVDDLQHLFAGAGVQTVVDAGHGVGGDHGDTVKNGGQKTRQIAVKGTTDHAQHQGRDAQCAADDMGDHIHDLFALGVAGQDPVTEFGSFHCVQPFLLG